MAPLSPARRRFIARALMVVLVPLTVAFGFSLTESGGVRVAIFIVSAIVGVVSLMVLLPEDDDPWVGITPAVVLGLALCGWPALQTADTLRLKWSGHVGPISVTEAPTHADAGSYEFDGARVLGDRRGLSIATHIEGDPDELHDQRVVDTAYVVAPLVPHNWQAGETIPAWLVMYSWVPLELPERFEAERVDSVQFDQAREHALNTHGLIDAKPSPIVQMRKPGALSIGGRLRLYGLSFVGLVGLFFGLTELRQRRQRPERGRKRRSKKRRARR